MLDRPAHAHERPSIARVVVGDVKILVARRGDHALVVQGGAGPDGWVECVFQSVSVVAKGRAVMVKRSDAPFTRPVSLLRYQLRQSSFQTVCLIHSFAPAG